MAKLVVVLLNFLEWATQLTKCFPSTTIYDEVSIVYSSTKHSKFSSPQPIGGGGGGNHRRKKWGVFEGAENVRRWSTQAYPEEWGAMKVARVDPIFHFLEQKEEVEED